MERVEEFEIEGRKFVYFDVSELRNNDEIESVFNAAKEVMPKYSHESVYTITNIANVIFDTRTKNIAASWLEFDRPYVVCGAVIGVDGIRRIMFNSVLKLGGRKNLKIFKTRQQAIEWLLSV